MKRGGASRAILAGIVSGLFLGLFLKVIERVTGIKVYTLLLNVDYVPFLNQIKLHETIEFGLHLIISIVLSLLIMKFLGGKRWGKGTKYSFIIGTSIIIGLILFPTTALSARTPELSSLAALSYWLVGHGLYGWLLAWLLRTEE